jgi:hypothetical protein
MKPRLVLKTNFQRRVFGVAALCASWLLSPVIAVSAAGSEGSNAPVVAESDDLAIYMADYDVDLDEASRRLGAQDLLSRVEEDLTFAIGPSLTYFRIVHKPVYQVEIGLAPQPSETVESVGQVLLGHEPQLSQHGLAVDDFVINHTAHRRADLDSAYATLSTLFAGYTGRSALNIDYVAGRIDLYVDQVDAFRAAIDSAPGLSQWVNLVHADGFPEAHANAYAGLTMSGTGGATCTAAFSVKNASGTKGILTAGHCDNTMTISGGQSLSYVLGFVSGNTDAQWHIASGGANLTFRNWAKDNSVDPQTPGYRLITSTSTTYTIGTFVCAYKWATGYDCGEIAHLTYDPDGPGGTFSASFLMIENTQGGDLSAGGDSGAGWWSVNKAVGIHWGNPWPQTNNALVGKISSATSNLGVSVLTS